MSWIMGVRREAMRRQVGWREVRSLKERLEAMRIMSSFGRSRKGVMVVEEGGLKPGGIIWSGGNDLFRADWLGITDKQTNKPSDRQTNRQTNEVFYLGRRRLVL